MASWKEWIMWNSEVTEKTGDSLASSKMVANIPLDKNVIEIYRETQETLMYYNNNSSTKELFSHHYNELWFRFYSLTQHRQVT